MKWAQVAALVGFVVHAMGILYGALPGQSLYPPPPLNSGIEITRKVENWLLQISCPPLDEYVRRVGLEQQWNTFAPVPPTFTAHLAVVGKAPQGSEVLLFSSLPRDPHGVSNGWNPIHKIIDRANDPRALHLHQGLARYYTRRFREMYGTDPEYIAIVSLLQDVPGPGDPTPRGEKTARTRVVYMHRP